MSRGAKRPSAPELFHPAVRAWFAKALGEPSAPQLAGWPLIAAREHTLIAAPTGSGKTLAAFLSALNELIELGLESELEERCYVLYVSPLKALSNDVEKNLQIPLEGIREELKQRGLPDVALRVSVRTGDTASSERARMLKKPPHVLVTTPESLYILLTSRGGRELLKGVRTLIVDEIHALVRDKRGSHLALSIERLEALAPNFVRVGLSATQKPIERVAEFLGGEESRGRPRAVHIVDTGHKRHLDLAIEVPPSPLEAVMAGEVWEEIYDRVAELIREHKTTLVFVNTRRVAERVTRHLATRLGEDKVTSHHGSLSREQRFRAEQRLKSGELSALVATASLELGIDVGAVELVCQLGSTRSIATLLQRVGRAGHSLGGVPKGRVFPLSRDELVEQVALLHAFERGELDQVQIPTAPLDILAQQLVAAVAAEEEWQSDALFQLVRRAYPYRELQREVFDDILEMLADGFTTRRGRRGAHLHYDRVGELVKPRRGARLTAMTNGGAIPDTFDYEVVADPGGYFVGTINEDFAIESMAGDIFQLGNASWRIVKVEPGRVRVEDAKGLPPSIPFWLGEAPARTDELSIAVSRLRAEVDEALSALSSAPPTSAELERLVERYTTEGVPRAAASQFVEYLAAAQQALGCLPTQDTLVLERFFDESGGMQLVLHAPFGGRVNRAWGLSLRKRFCQRFNFELQAAATEDALILSLGPTHSFPLEEVFRYLHPNTVRPLLIQALLVAPMFETRWRWNATRSLAISRFRGGSRVPPRLQRMNAADLLTLVFPDQVACQENLEGPREVPEHPLVQQTVNDCLVEAMDVTAFEAVLGAIVAGEKRLVARDLTEPSPLSLEILSARPYAFLDDAPLEERRTQAVSARRWLSPAQASELGALDPEAIARVQDEAWPTVRDQDELADALQVLGVVCEESANELGWLAGLEELGRAGRVTRLTTGQGRSVWVAVERLAELRSVYLGATEAPALTLPPKLVPSALRSQEEILVELMRGQVECRGPLRAARLAYELALSEDSVELALLSLETEGFVLRGSFTPAVGQTPKGVEWCERGLLARIHRYTLARLRSEIEPVTQADFMRFLLRWQRVEPGQQGSGPDALAQVLDQLEGFEAPAAAWEQEILPARIADYEPAWLDLLCLSGRVTWLRRTPPQSVSARRSKPAPVRATPVALVSRANLGLWSADEELRSGEGPELSPAAARVKQVLQGSGACFFMDLMGRSGLLRTQVEEGLAELVALGLANSDSFAGLRALIVPTAQRGQLRGQLHRRHGRRAGQGMELGGRWSLFDAALADPSAPNDTSGNQTEQIARRLLVRWGVVFRKLLEREPGLPPWRDLVRVLRRLEARGEIRGGRFVAGFSGEQYALPEAVSQLRALRREHTEPALVSISAADPLNLRGLTLAGERVPALLTNRLCFRAGEVVGTKQGREIQVVEAEESWVIRQTLVRTGALGAKTADVRLGWRGNRSHSTH